MSRLPDRDAQGRMLPGNRIAGEPGKARTRRPFWGGRPTNAFALMMSASFQARGADVLAELREGDPLLYLKLCAKVLALDERERRRCRAPALIEGPPPWRRGQRFRRDASG